MGQTWISIILPVYNAGLYLNDAVSSLLKQTHSEFELICIDDGSADNSLQILTEYAKKDPRVKIISRENKGLIYTLNEAIGLAKYRYIARMDADDICEKNRLELQLIEMKSKNLAIIGSSYHYIDKSGGNLGSRMVPTSNLIIGWLMDFGSPLCHPSVLFDKDKLGKDLVYDANFEHCEDYELWLRCRALGYRFGNLKEITFKYRVLESSISRLNNKAQRQASINLIVKYCTFVMNESEAEYILYNRKYSNNVKLNIKFWWRNIVQFKFFKSVFIFLYLIK